MDFDIFCIVVGIAYGVYRLADRYLDIIEKDN